MHFYWVAFAAGVISPLAIVLGINAYLNRTRRGPKPHRHVPKLKSDGYVPACSCGWKEKVPRRSYHASYQFWDKYHGDDGLAEGRLSEMLEPNQKTLEEHARRLEIERKMEDTRLEIERKVEDSRREIDRLLYDEVRNKYRKND